MAGGRGSIRLKREPNYWEVRAYAGRDPVSGKHRYVSRTVRGGKRDAQRTLARLTTDLQTHGPTTRHTINELLAAHVDHLEARGRQARTIEGYRTIARGVESDRTLGTTPLRTKGAVIDNSSRANSRLRRSCLLRLCISATSCLR